MDEHQSDTWTGALAQGPGNNYLIHWTHRFTLNADGEQMVQHENLSVECR